MAKRSAIKVDVNGYIYLQARSFMERSGLQYITTEHKNRLRANFEKHAYKGQMVFADWDLGGAVNGRWTDWSAADMASMLDAAGWPCEPTEIDIIDV